MRDHDPVDLVEPVAEHADPDGDRHRGEAEPDHEIRDLGDVGDAEHDRADEADDQEERREREPLHLVALDTRRAPVPEHRGDDGEKCSSHKAEEDDRVEETEVVAEPLHTRRGSRPGASP